MFLALPPRFARWSPGPFGAPALPAHAPLTDPTSLVPTSPPVDHRLPCIKQGDVSLIAPNLLDASSASAISQL